MSALVALPPAREERSSVVKAMTLLSYFESGSTLGISELARRSGLPKSTVFRLVRTLEQSRFLVRCTGGYRVGDRLIGLGRAAMDQASNALIMRTRPYLARLFCSISGSVELSVLEDNSVRLLDVITHPRAAPITFRPGDLIPAEGCAAGRVLIGHPVVAESCIDPRENVLGGRASVTAAISVPGVNLAAITVASPCGTPSHDLDRLAGHVAQCASQVYRGLLLSSTSLVAERELA